MSMQRTAWPKFVVLNGLMRGIVFTIPLGRSALSIKANETIELTEPNSPRCEAILEHAHGRVLIASPDWRRAVRVNGSQLSSEYEIRDGDVVEVGLVRLEFRGMPAVIHDRSSSSARDETRISFGNVHGPVQTGKGKQYNAGRDQFFAGRDLYKGTVRVSNDYSPWDEFFSGRGFGRFLMALGSLIALAGFSMWAYVILSGFDSSSPYDDPFKLELFPGVPMAPVGFAAFGAGGILVAIGVGLSKAARKRQEQGR
jgi:hypothetical protein